MQSKRFDGHERPKPGRNKVDGGDALVEVEAKHDRIYTNLLKQDVWEVDKDVGLQTLTRGAS